MRKTRLQLNIYSPGDPPERGLLSTTPLQGVDAFVLIAANSPYGLRRPDELRAREQSIRSPPSNSDDPAQAEQ